MKPGDAHLSREQVERLWLEQTGQAQISDSPGDEGEQARKHLADCTLCQTRVRAYDSAEKDLAKLKATSMEPRQPACPPATVWSQLAARLAQPAESDGWLEHAAECDYCGQLLRQATEDFDEKLTPEETRKLANLKSSQPGWQHQMAERLAAESASTAGGPLRAEPHPPPRWRKPFTLWPRWALVASVVLLAAMGTWITLQVRTPAIDQLLAQSYTEQRPFEMRIAGAAYGPLRQERAADRSLLAQPAALLQAKYLLKEKLAARPDDAALLAASGRIELLEGNYEEAIRTFGRLLDRDPDSQALLSDLAIAYFQRAEAGDRAIDYGRAIELLGQILAESPDDPIALFNRAIALEKSYAYTQAIRDWNHYLRVEPSGDWAEEARRRLSELQEKLKEHEKPAVLLHSDPGTAVRLLQARASGQPVSPVPWAASLDEEYLGLAVREWLPSLYVSVGSHGQASWKRRPVVWDALVATADILSTYHKDHWLAELLHDLPAESASADAMDQFAAALDALAGAAKANAVGDPDSARPLAQSAARSFQTLHSTAGFLRAREEIILSLLRVAESKDCIEEARRQLREVKLNSYVWLQGQAILWHATCHGAAGNLGLAQRLSERAVELTKATGYAGQHLRSILFASGFLSSTERNWQLTRAGLQKFWGDFYNPFHAYESYVELAILAEEAENWHLARPLYCEALGMISRTPDRPYQAVAHYRLAVAAMMVGDLHEAESEFIIASEQFAKLPVSPATDFYRMTAEIRLAAVEVQQDKLDSAAVRLEQVGLHLANIPGTWATFNYHLALGRLHLRRRNLPEAEQALWTALNVGEVRLSSLGSDEDRLAWERETGPAYRTLVELYARKPDSTTQALEVWEWYRASALRGLTASSPARQQVSGGSNAGPGLPPLSRVRETLPSLKRETVISFALLPSGVAAWAFDDRGVHFTLLPASEEDLIRRVRHFAYLCSNPSSDLTHLRQQASNLYALLLAPLARHLEPRRHLIIEPDSILSEVPWSALVDSEGEYLGSRFTIVVSPGLGYMLNLRSPTSISAGQRALVVGMPVALRLSPLPDADSEARSIAARFHRSRLLSGKAVTPAAIRQGLEHSNVFHFAGHAVSGTRQSGLVLASRAGQDGMADEPTLLSANQLEDVVLAQLQLVVLSACATAETEKGFTEPGTLVRSFLRARVPQVIASRWPVDSQTTRQTMDGFYSHLFQGQPTASALRQAADQLRLRTSTSHPYYWAAFDAYGR